MKKKLCLLAFLAILSMGALAQSPLDYARRMAQSEIKRNPEIWMADFLKKPKWDYTQGLIAKAMLQLWKETQNEDYYRYAKGLVDQFIDSNGQIATYKLRDYNIDRVNPGRALLDIYAREQEPRVKIAIDSLRAQLRSQPRTSEQGFWHKKIYPHQMWLDGLYMGSPFYTEYISRYGQPSEYADVARQFEVVHRHTYDPTTGLNRHGWDESKSQAWADTSSGCSPESWGRAMGWYAMALVDVLELLPAHQHQERKSLLQILADVAYGIKNYQDPASGLWYQVLNHGGKEGNYLEATVSCMFTYTLAKGLRLGYLDQSYRPLADKAFEGIKSQLLRVEADSSLSLTHCCAVAGLGGKPYRSGTYEYYVNEKIRDNDPKGVGPFIFACLEMQKLQPLAFPGAEGAGKYTSGGRGGIVYIVSNLNDSGEGSLRAAVESKKGPRTIVFAVDGTIELLSTLDIRRGDLTIAGESAPGDGICISGHPIELRADNIIIRYLRFRLGDAQKVEDDAINGMNGQNIIIDHCSMSWATDECATFYGNKDFTLQWCFITESLNQSVHRKGSHGYGGIWGGDQASFHHNLIAHHNSRNPRFTHPGLKHSKYWGVCDFRNNVVFNWGNNSLYGGEDGQTNIVNNYFKPGPATPKKRRNRIVEISRSESTGNYGRFHITGNVMEGMPTITPTQQNEGIDSDTSLTAVLSPYPFPFSPIAQQSAQEAYESVLSHAGASLHRDAVDSRIAQEVRSGIAPSGKNFGGGKKGIIDSPKDVGGYPSLQSRTAPLDSDKDGMPDEWEIKKGLNPKSFDASLFSLSPVYTNLEIYLHSLVPHK